MKEIKVVVMGLAGSGKSAVAQLIEETLSGCGIRVEFQNPDHGPRSTEALQQCLKSLSEIDTKVTIEERSLARDGTERLPLYPH